MLNKDIYNLKVWLTVYGINENLHEMLELEELYYGNIFDKNPHEYWEEVDKYTNTKIKPCDKKVAFFEPLARQVIESVVAHTFGRDKFPEISLQQTGTIYTDPNNIVAVDKKEEAQKKLNRFVNALKRQTLLGHVMIKASRQALLLGGVALAFKILNGKFFIDIISRKDIQIIQFDENDRNIVLRLREVWRSKEPDPNDPTNYKVFWHCREINTEREIDFLPTEDTGKIPDFNNIEIANTIEHGLGFCPVVWCSFTNDLSLFYGMVEDLKQFSRFSSMIFLGLEKNLNAQFAFMSDDSNEVEGIVRSSDNLWTLPNGTLKSLSATGNYQEAMTFRDRMRDSLLKALRVSEIPVDNYQAAEALKMRLAPELNLVEECRVLFGEKALVQLLELMIRASTIVNGRTTIDKQGNTIIERVDLGEEIEIPQEPNIYVNLTWGEIFTITAQTRNLEVQTMVMATNKVNNTEPIFPKAVVRDYLAKYIGIEDRDAVEKQIRVEGLKDLWLQTVNNIIAKELTNEPVKALELLKMMAEDTNNDNIDFDKYLNILQGNETQNNNTVLDTVPSESTVNSGSGL